MTRKKPRCRKCHFRPCRCEDLRCGISQNQLIRGRWPRESDALGVHPSQIQEARAEAKRLGTTLEFKKNGAAIVESQHHQNELCRKFGMVDRSREITMPVGIRPRERSVGRSRG